MSSFHLTTYPIVALVLFLVAFAALCGYVYSRGNRQAMHAAGLLPLADAPSSVEALPAAGAQQGARDGACCGRCTGRDEQSVASLPVHPNIHHAQSSSISASDNRG
jgi:cbb3-type cytochrome oxidase subunit 3